MSDRADRVALPSGLRVRARGLAAEPAEPAEGPPPTFGLYLGSQRLRRRYEASLTWPHDWLRWPDFWVPRDRAVAVSAVRDVHRRLAGGEEVEVACGGGVGRTGTVLACLAVLDGLSAQEAIAWVRSHHHPRSVEMPWQRGWISRFASDAG